MEVLVYRREPKVIVRPICLLLELCMPTYTRGVLVIVVGFGTAKSTLLLLVEPDHLIQERTFE